RARHDPAPPGHRPHRADLPPPGPAVPVDRRRRQRAASDPRLAAPNERNPSEGPRSGRICRRRARAGGGNKLQACTDAAQRSSFSPSTERWPARARRLARETPWQRGFRTARGMRASHRSRLPATMELHRAHADPPAAGRQGWRAGRGGATLPSPACPACPRARPPLLLSVLLMQSNIVTFFAAALVVGGLSAQTYHYAPFGYDTFEGTSNNTIPFWAQSGVYQQVHDA